MEMYAEYVINARSIERKFKRGLTKNGYFLTAKGCINHLVEYGKTHFSIKTDKGKEPIVIKRSAIRKAASYFFFKRTAIREDFEKFSNFTSAVFAIIFECFRNKSKLQLLKGGRFRISLLATRWYASGLERDPSILKLFKNLNGKYVLFNYKSILESPNCLHLLDKLDLYCIIDSGAFSIFNQQRKNMKNPTQQQHLFEVETLDSMILEGYARFINEHKNNHRIMGFFPLDCIGDPVQTKKNYKRLKELTDAKIYPVWQFTDSLDELDRLVQEEHEMIGLGGLVPLLKSQKHVIREVLDKVIERYPAVNFHALGISDELLQEYRIFSADSTSFLNARKYKDGRKIYLPNGERVTAPEDMTTLEIIKQNLSYLIGVEQIRDIQLSFTEIVQEGA